MLIGNCYENIHEEHRVSLKSKSIGLAMRLSGIICLLRLALQNLSNDFKSKLSFVESPDSATIGSLTYPGYQKVEKSYRNNARDLLLHAIEKGLHFNRRTLDGYGNFKIDTYLQNLTNTKNTDTSSEAVEATQRFIKDFDIPNRFIKNAF